MNQTLTICITETLQRVIEVNIDNMDCDAVEYVRSQHLDEDIILNSLDLVDTEFEIMRALKLNDTR